MPVALGAAAITGAASLGAAWIGSNAAHDASAAQIQQQQQALAFQKQMYGEAVGRAQPYLGVGGNAASTLSGIYGWANGNGTGTQPPGTGVNWQAYMNTPDYQWAQQQGMRALDMSAASKHLLNSGGMVQEAQNFGQGLAGQQFGNTIQRLMSMMTIGNNANASITGAGNVASGNVGNTYGQMGQTMASGITGGANPWISALNTGPGNALGAYSYANNQGWGGGGGGGTGNPLSLASSSYLPNNAMTSTGGLW